ncbi:MAG: hypothetical protein NDP13_04480 [Crenarchaeota archaeon]|nr:hypothetical protein [Thermoproteota archaeon]MCR8472182.1 hypothetical protein [Thermoproteota archaeon]MCR8472992.1 hypothetical protein [Thermoproteota archaeon]MCR8488766.1 hypothetical protein [Thermoproteota archaeon]MCR8501318.1 hypothetical protein [Thermoproteota archaeon]
MWLISTIVGPVILDDNGNVISYKIYGKEKPSLSEVIEGIKKLEKKECPSEFETLIKEQNIDRIKTDSEIIAEILKGTFSKLQIEVVYDGPELTEVRNGVHKFLERLFGTYEKYVEFANATLVEITRDKLREVGEEPDKMIIQAITMIEELTEATNALMAHLREWFGIVFPELGKIIDDHRKFATIVYEIGNPSRLSAESKDREEYVKKLEQILGNKKTVDRILEALETSAPVKITDKDEKELRSVAKLVLDMFNLRDDLETYLQELMEDTCPNLTKLAGPTIGAKLIRKTGGLRQLALKPASTIQVLGAEKALFRALRGKGTPPKHGILFTHPFVFRAPWWQRGKIARTLASKLAIAARVDYFSKEYIGDELWNELLQRVEEIKKKYAKPPPEKMKRPKPRLREKKRK